MDEERNLYRELQLFLDRETLGFPETPSGSDIRLLTALFTPDEAKAVMHLTYKFSTLDEAYGRASKSDFAREELGRILDECAGKGLIAYKKQDGVKYYRTIHYLLGMAEGGLHGGKPKPEFLSAMNQYAKDGLFWKAFLNTKVPQMRTIPIEQSLTDQKQVATFDQVKELVLNSEGPYVIYECACRKGARLAQHPCKRTSRKETCMSLGKAAETIIEFGKGRQISQGEALEILAKNQEEGLVLQPSNTQAADFICSCCGCCCGIFRLHKVLPNPVKYWTTNYHAEVDPDACTACGTCVDICNVAAIELGEDDDFAKIDIKRCLGCGNCVAKCPADAIALVMKEQQVIPPMTGEDLNEVIMTNK
ncbi:MAG: 4Fe-4S dicluster domain-containing protein [Deltaproteobacteria bacterium]|nr:4Fe-4S dicluster domain-containing protein [Deltaproteobacteria bacterium]